MNLGISDQVMVASAPDDLPSGKFAAAAAISFAVIFFALGLVGSAFDEASAADTLLSVGVPQTVTWNWSLDHVIWFAIANFIAGAGFLMLSGWFGARRKAHARSRRYRVRGYTD